MKIAILGYGNLGRGVESAIKQNPDIELVCIFTRRDPDKVKVNTKNVKVLHVDDAIKMKDEIDVLILCGGSATDLPEQTPYYAKYFNVIDSFDTHAKIPEHISNIEKSCKESGKVAMVSVGWDPGLFSLNRLYGEAALPCGNTYTFWGKGVSQGHSDAIRRIEGVIDARQYTIPVESAVESVRKGENPNLSTSDKHIRECFVVADEGYDKSKIENEIKTMPNYFAEYKTIVHFITKEEMEKDHSGLPHGGTVIRSGRTGNDCEHSQVIEYKLNLDSNPEFTSSVIIAYARAVYKMSKDGMSGCKTVFDVPPIYLCNKQRDEIIKELL